MKNYTAKKLLKLSTKKQKEWVEEQDWYKDENFEQKLHDAPVDKIIGTLVLAIFSISK